MSILSELVREKLATGRLSDRAAAREIGVSPTTIGRLLRGEAVDVDTLVKVCRWLGVTPASVLNSYEPSNLADSVAVVIEANPQLAATFVELVEKIRVGELSPALLRDVVAYAAYKLDLEVLHAREANVRRTDVGNPAPGRSNS